MAVKVMGITSGRKNGNSEILLKEALMACEEAGAEVTMINLKDYTIQNCIGCYCCSSRLIRTGSEYRSSRKRSKRYYI